MIDQREGYCKEQGGARINIVPISNAVINHNEVKIRMRVSTPAPWNWTRPAELPRTVSGVEHLEKDLFDRPECSLLSGCTHFLPHHVYITSSV